MYEQMYSLNIQAGVSPSRYEQELDDMAIGVPLRTAASASDEIEHPDKAPPLTSHGPPTKGRSEGQARQGQEQDRDG
jgi:hypothetical protein